MMQNVGPRENRSANSWPIRDSWRFAPFRSNVHELRGGSNAEQDCRLSSLLANELSAAVVRHQFASTETIGANGLIFPPPKSYAK
jgi:hypothetical protein